MTYSYAQTHFQQVAKDLTVYEPVFSNQDTFVLQTPRKQTYQLNRKLSSLFEQHFPAHKFCFYKITQYTVNNHIISNQYKLVWRVNGITIDIWYTFFQNQRMHRINGKMFLEAAVAEKDAIVDFFLQAIEELPENRLLVTTNAVPLRYS